MSGLSRPTLPLALSALALLLIAATPAGAEPPGGEAAQNGSIGATTDIGSKQAPLLPVPQPAPDRPPAHPEPEPEKSPAPAHPEPEPEKSLPTEAQSKPEQSPLSDTAKPGDATPPDNKPEAGAPSPKNLKPIAPEEAVGILGKKVYGPADEDMGMVVDVVVGGDGRPRAAVIDFGGFLGVGSRKIAVDWELLQFRPADRNQPVRLSLGRAEVQAAPEYKPYIQQAEIVAPPTPADTSAAPDAEK